MDVCHPFFQVDRVVSWRGDLRRTCFGLTLGGLRNVRNAVVHALTESSRSLVLSSASNRSIRQGDPCHNTGIKTHSTVSERAGVCASRAHFFLYLHRDSTRPVRNHPGACAEVLDVLK